MGAIYLIFAFVYPIYLTILIAGQEEKDMGVRLPRIHLIFQRMFSRQQALEVNLPWVVLFGIHFLFLVPEIACRQKLCQRTIEALAVLGLCAIFVVELSRDMAFKADVLPGLIEMQRQTSALILQLIVWMLVYALHFCSWA